MPHLVVSYARPLEKEADIQKIVEHVFQGAEESGLFKTPAIKVRALPVDHFVTAGTDQPFVHVDAKLFAGRTDEQKQDLIKRLFDKIDALVNEQVTISVEAIDMDTPNYIKR